MVRTFLAIAVLAQTAVNRFEKPPQNVDDALRARVTRFYQLHVTHKTREAEALVAADSKDDFYEMRKLPLESFEIGEILYSDGFTKAKVRIVAQAPILFVGMTAPEVKTIPFPSYWKLENGEWFWSANRSLETPFGTAKAHGEAAGAAALPVQRPTVDTVMNSVKVDRSQVTLSRAPGSSEYVVFQNDLPGPVTIEVAQVDPRIEVQIQDREVPAGAKVKITLRAKEGALSGVVRFLVQPINRTIDVRVSMVN